MVRTRVKGNGMKAAASPLTEPDFYAMEFCLESTDPTRPEITSMNKDFNDETETDGMESGETTTEDEEDCCASIMEQPQLHGKYPDASCSSPSVKIVTPYSSPRHNCHKPNSSMDVAHQLEWPTCSATLGSTLWETVSTNSSSDFDFPPLYHDFKNKIAKTSETLSLASILSPPPVLIAALQHNFRDDYDDRDWVLPQHEEFSVLDEGEEAFFEGRKFRFLDRYQPVDQTLTSIVVLGAEKSTQQRPEDIFGSFTSV